MKKKKIDEILDYPDEALLKQFKLMCQYTQGEEEWNDGMSWDEACMTIYSELGDRGISVD